MPRRASRGPAMAQLRPAPGSAPRLLRPLAALLLLVLLAHWAAPAAAYTDPNNYNKLVAFRDAMRTRSPNWRAALELWTCPTPPANSVPAGTCDPCGEGSDGNWYHMHCRGGSRGWGESGDGTKNGISTNLHITSSQVDGPVPKEACILPTLREHDFGGELHRGHLTGPIPRFLGRCYPALEELDLSNNRLTGMLPPYLAKLPLVSEIKVENNALIGTIPPELGSISRLRRFQVEYNNMRGRVPESFRAANPYLTQLHLARNDFEGDLSMLAGGHLTTVTVHDNPKLCGMVPASVRFAKGYNPGNTGLGKPCPGGGGGAPAAAPAPAPRAGGESGSGGGNGTSGAGSGSPSPSPPSPSPAAQSPAPASSPSSSPQASDAGASPSGTGQGGSEEGATTAFGAASPSPPAAANGGQEGGVQAAAGP